MAKAEATPAPEATPEAPPAPDKAELQAQQPSYGNELKRFEEPAVSVEIPEGLPERFLKDGKPDYTNLTKSYVELDRAFKTKTEELREQVKAEMFKDRPEKPEAYAVPDQFKGTIPDDSPVLEWWREQAHNAGMSQEAFNDGITKYIERAQALFDPEKEKAKLGDNADARIDAVRTWTEKNFDDSEREVLSQTMSSAAGIKLLEKMMRGNSSVTDVENAPPPPSITLEKLRSMQNDPRYFDPSRRDPDWVKQVDEGFQKLYGGS